MTDEQIRDVCKYIKTHKPEKTKVETISVAISVVTKGFCSAATEEDMVNRDDSWLIPDEKKGKLAGIRGRGWAQSLPDETIKLFEEAYEYAVSHESEIKERTSIEEIKELKKQILNFVNNVPDFPGTNKDEEKFDNSFDAFADGSINKKPRL